jgi:peroxiredoxin
VDTSQIASGANWEAEKMIENEARSRVRHGLLSTMVLASSLLLAACSGEQEEQANDNKKLSFANHTANRNANRDDSGGNANRALPELAPIEPKVAIEVPPPPVLPATKPFIAFSAGHAATNLIKVGEAFPAATLPDTAGQRQELSKLFGQRLTVIVFWQFEHAYAESLLAELPLSVVKPHGAFGVSAIGVNVRDDAQAISRFAQEKAIAFPLLLDTDQTVYAKLATGRIPRVYLLDANGKVLWFDIEYSESTRRELENAIRWHLQDNNDSA